MDEQNEETLDTKTPTERDILLEKFATAVRTIPGHGATIAKGKRNFLKVFTPTGAVFNVKVG